MTSETRRAGGLAGLLALCALALGGCAEKKTCFFQCYQPQLEGYRDDGSCGFVEDVAEEECAALDLCLNEQRARRAWGEIPPWCDAERYERHLH